MTRLQCVAHTEFWPMSMFLFGATVLTYLIAKHNNLDLKGALLALVGCKKIQRNFLIYVWHVALILCPLGVWMWLIGICDPTLYNNVGQ